MDLIDSASFASPREALSLMFSVLVPLFDTHYTHVFEGSNVNRKGIQYSRGLASYGKETATLLIFGLGIAVLSVVVFFSNIVTRDEGHDQLEMSNIVLNRDRSIYKYFTALKSTTQRTGSFVNRRALLVIFSRRNRYPAFDF